MKLTIQIPNLRIYLILFIVYFVCDIMFPANGIGIEVDSSNRVYPQVSMGLIFLYSIYYIMQNYVTLVNCYAFRPFIYYLLMCFLYILFINGERTLFDNFVQFMKITLALCVFVFIYISMKNNPRNIKYVYTIYCIIFIYSLIVLVRDYYMMMIAEAANADEGFDSNSGFMLASLIPMAFLLPMKRAKLVVYALALGACLVSGQRAAALGALISVPIAYRYMKASLSKKDLRVLFFLAIVLFIIAFPYIVGAIENLILRTAVDADRGDVGSGRSVFWALVIKSFFLSSPIKMLFGHGYFAINDMLETEYGMAIGAHNGFLDHLYTFGIIGLLLYLGIYLLIYKIYHGLRVNHSSYSLIVLMIMLIFLFRSATSHGWLDLSYIPFFMPLAIILAKHEREMEQIYVCDDRRDDFS